MNKQVSIIAAGSLFVFSVLLGASLFLSGNTPLQNVAFWYLEILVFIILFSSVLRSRVLNFVTGDLVRQLYIGAATGFMSGILTAPLILLALFASAFRSHSSLSFPATSVIIMGITYGIFGAIGGGLSSILIVSSVTQGTFRNKASAAIASLLVGILVICTIVKFDIGPRSKLNSEVSELRGAKIELNKRDARILNDEGYKLLKERRYRDALDKFRQSASLDNKYANAQYNYACTMSILSGLEACPPFSQSEIISALSRAIEIEPSKKEKLLTDLDLTNMRKNFDFWKLSGIDLNSAENIKTILNEIEWYGPLGSGKQWHLSGVDFQPNGSFGLWIRNYGEGTLFNTISYKGKYFLEGRQIRLNFNSLFKGTKEAIASINENGEIVSNSLPGPFKGRVEKCDDALLQK